ncbi:MAG: hypothetical protein ACR2G2_00175 [Pseudonocardia sp.]
MTVPTTNDRATTAPAGGWLALRLAPAGELFAPVLENGWDAGFLCGWPAGPRPVPGALRVDERLFDPGGPPCRVSLVLLPESARPIADDPIAVQARRAVLRDGRVAVSLLIDDPVHLAGSLTVARADRPEELLALRDDPFARIGVPRLLDVGPGLLGTAPSLPGPVLERYAGAPWPLARW